MNVRNTASQRGIGLFEVVMSLVIGGAALLAAITVVASADQLSSSTRQRMRATAEYRQAHKEVGKILQSVALETLTGFDPVTGEATAPGFKSVTGMVDGEVVYGPATELKFVAGGVGAAGVAIGNLVIEAAGEAPEVVVPNLVAGAFRVRQEGRNLVVRLQTFHAVPGKEPVILEGETVVSLRN